MTNEEIQHIVAKYRKRSNQEQKYSFNKRAEFNRIADQLEQDIDLYVDDELYQSEKEIIDDILEWCAVHDEFFAAEDERDDQECLIALNEIANKALHTIGKEEIDSTMINLMGSILCGINSGESDELIAAKAKAELSLSGYALDKESIIEMCKNAREKCQKQLFSLEIAMGIIHDYHCLAKDALSQIANMNRAFKFWSQKALETEIAPKMIIDAKLIIENNPKERTVEQQENNECPALDTSFDPRQELPEYKFPTLEMLNDYDGKDSGIDGEELYANKNKIVETLGNYGIAIDKIKATIGPTVTLYEIVPAAGIRISKIKNLEDDIALSLVALGVRIIAPIPGKAAIGIEVPNSKPETVSMRSVLASEKFQTSKYALPCAIGKTISNETYVFDLAKMPHILMAGATGQGKSVGLNAIIASLLYSKHPSELKFVMVDPKKVELTLYNRIERHYLAKLPDSEDAIITDVRQVVRTLNSLCIEMDQRYDLLKAAECRNIIEYNEKFKSRRLLPTEGHRFLPYIVLVVDEFADLIMTAGREVEAPIARLAQLARAIGIHLIIATQRPSVNIITGSIKANFPARIAFRVISQVDSKTILDQSGANQLIGRGDMLFSTGNDLVRLQCAFIDTPEIEAITHFISEQQGFEEPYLLPNVPEEDEPVEDGYDALSKASTSSTTRKPTAIRPISIMRRWIKLFGKEKE